MTDFYEFSGGSTTNSQVEDKSDIDLDQDIPLCDICSNVILKPYKQNKLFCPSCGNVYDPHYELIQVQDQEMTLDELSSQGVITTKQDDIKPRVTLNREKGNKHENPEYVRKEFSRYKEIEIIDKDTITSLNKTRRHNTNHD